MDSRAVVIKNIVSDLKMIEHSVTNTPSLEVLNCKLILAQAEYNKALFKFNETNPSEKKRSNPPGYVSWAHTGVQIAQRNIDELDIKHTGNLKTRDYYTWLLTNLDAVDALMNPKN